MKFVIIDWTICISEFSDFFAVGSLISHQLQVIFAQPDFSFNSKQNNSSSISVNNIGSQWAKKQTSTSISSWYQQIGIVLIRLSRFFRVGLYFL